MTIEDINAHIGKRIKELKSKKGIANYEVHVDIIFDSVINELEHLHDLTAVSKSRTSQPIKFADTHKDHSNTTTHDSSSPSTKS